MAGETFSLILWNIKPTPNQTAKNTNTMVLDVASDTSVADDRVKYAAIALITTPTADNLKALNSNALTALYAFVLVCTWDISNTSQGQGKENKDKREA